MGLGRGSLRPGGPKAAPSQRRAAAAVRLPLLRGQSRGGLQAEQRINPHQATSDSGAVAARLRRGRRAAIAGIAGSAGQTAWAQSAAQSRARRLAWGERFPAPPSPFSKVETGTSCIYHLRHACHPALGLLRERDTERVSLEDPPQRARLSPPLPLEEGDTPPSHSGCLHLRR